MMTEIKLIQLQPDELKGLITESVNQAIEAIKKTLQPCSDDNLLTRKQACEFLQIDSSTLWEWTKKGKIQAYGTGGRRYYKKSELLNALVPLHVKRSNNFRQSA